MLNKIKLPLISLIITTGIYILLMLPKYEAAKILTVIPFPMKSHDRVYKPLLLELAKRGHKVTAIGPYPLDKNNLDEDILDNYNEIIYESEYKDAFRHMDFYEMKRDTSLLNIGWLETFVFWDLTMKILEDIYENSKIKDLLINRNNETFDLIICEGFFGFESLFAFGDLYKSPVIAVATFGSNLYINQHIGNPIGSSYYPNFLLPYTDKMNLIQRLHNFLLNSYVKIITNLYNIPYQERLIDKYFKKAIQPPRKMSPLANMLSEVSMVFVNTHLAIGHPRPNVPNVVDIGGLHIHLQENVIKDMALQKLMDDANQGFIYFSLGSNVNIANMPERYLQAFVKAFSNIPQLVLWKWEDASYLNRSNNIHISKWYPQQQVLAHNNCMAFITHGGILSLEEAVFNGVPVIGIPFFGDQPMNMKRVEEINFGIMLDYDNITYKSLSWSLNEITNNKKYRENGKKLSSIFRDNIGGTALDRGIYWVEYIIKYNGAPHLKTTARLLPWYKYLLLDVISIIILLIFIIGYVLYILIRILLNIFNFISINNFNDSIEKKIK